MKVEKNLIEKVAGGKTILKGEAVRIANYIIEMVCKANLISSLSIIMGMETRYMTFKTACWISSHMGQK